MALHVLDPRLRPIPVERWPDLDRAAWQAALQPGDPFSPGGLAAHWRPTTRGLVARCYGLWLAFLEERGELGSGAGPGERLSRTAIKDYVESMQSHLRAATVTICIDSLVRAISVMTPNADITWLRRLLQHLKRQTRDCKSKINRIRPTRDLYHLGLKLMAEAEAEPSLRPCRAAVQYRDGLMIAFLAARPLRISTFAALKLERHLAIRGDRYWLDIPGDIMKSGKPLEVPLPADLTPYLERYLAVYRPLLLGGDAGDNIWISQFGAPLSRFGISGQIRFHTREEFGESITPQLFRDCAATSIAVQDPDHVHVAAILLGHKTLSTTQRYYNQARLLDASRRYHAQIRKLRGPLRQGGRHP